MSKKRTSEMFYGVTPEEVLRYIRKLEGDNEALQKYIRELQAENAAQAQTIERLREALRISNDLLAMYHREKYAICILSCDVCKAIKNNKLQDLITPAEKAIKKVFPSIEVKKDSVSRILHGQPLYEKDLVKKEKYEKDTQIAVFSGKQFIGMFKVLDAVKIFAKSEFTLQEMKN